MSYPMSALSDFRFPSTVDRKFAVILLLSLALHGVFALALHAPKPPVEPPVLIAHLRFSEAAAPARASPVAEAAHAQPAPLPPKARQAVSPEVPRSVPPANTPARPAIAPRAMPASEAAQPLVSTTTSAAPAVETAKPAVPASASPATSAASPTLSVDALGQYRRQLVELFARQHAYPRIAALRGWEGEVRLRLKVARKGNLLDIQLDHSSGFEVLDRDALALLEAYGSLPPLPEALESNEISVIVPINYKLKKTT